MRLLRFTDGTTHTDPWFVLFSPHTAARWTTCCPTRRTLHTRISGLTLVDLLHRFPNVLAWVNGHTHDNKITPWKGKTAHSESNRVGTSVDRNVELLLPGRS